MNVLVLESHEEDGVKWGVSFTDHNPELKDYVECATKEDAFKLKRLIEGNF